MKSVYLFRHGESDLDSSVQYDYQRPLAKGGIYQAKQMGKVLSQKKSIPDLVISSFAKRALDTINYAMNEADWSSDFKVEKEIYGGSPAYLLELLHQQNNKYKSICLVGHEPNFSSFVSKSTASSYVKFPTAGIVKIDFDVNRWDDIVFGFGQLDFFLNPETNN